MKKRSYFLFRKGTERKKNIIFLQSSLVYLKKHLYKAFWSNRKDKIMRGARGKEQVAY